MDCIKFTFAGNYQVEVRLSADKNQPLVELTQTQIPLDNKSKEAI
ncbi:MAG: hypothetical protein ACI9DK_002019 [Vicingaceae bacterium]|jgi:hypothetical protein